MTVYIVLEKRQEKIFLKQKRNWLSVYFELEQKLLKGLENDTSLLETYKMLSEIQLMLRLFRQQTRKERIAYQKVQYRRLKFFDKSNIS
jgi:hypothetical protein